ncbi:MAG: hypothetical protein EHM70_21970 [Chloroflexota bacterium]|nr:MAG: hypothetical protein EHM70_21970 [Chloroflexota bacterium]
MDENKKVEKYRVGIAVFILLLCLTLGEFGIGAIAPVWVAPLVGIALLKAWFIVRDYMHLPRLFSPEEDHS